MVFAGKLVGLVCPREREKERERERERGLIDWQTKRQWKEN